MEISSASRGRWLDWFERLLVFRVARGYFFLMAVFAVLMLLAGVVAGTLGFVRFPIFEPTPPPEVPALEPLSLAHVEAWTQEQETQPPSSQQQPMARAGEQRTPSPPPRTKQRERDEIKSLTEALRALFPEPDYVWDDLYEKYCKRSSTYGCLQTGRKLVEAGVSDVLSRAVPRRPREERIETLQVLIRVLGEAPVERRGDLILSTAEAYRDRNDNHRRKVEEREDEITLARDEYESAVAEQQASKERMRIYGFYGVVAGFALLILVSMFLAHLAIERHMRMMRAVLDALPGPTPGAPTPQVGGEDPGPEKTPAQAMTPRES